MKLCRLIYFSRARIDTSDSKRLHSLAASSGARNSVHDVTGALAASNDAFLQLLEGPRSELSKLLGRLYGDTRHEGLVVAGMDEVKTRLFPAWAMTLAEPKVGAHEFTYEQLRDQSSVDLIEHLAGRRLWPELDAYEPIDTHADTIAL
ncbi:MAG: BLUF domain-containing protein [Pseudomonadota bacterium]